MKTIFLLLLFSVFLLQIVPSKRIADARVTIKSPINFKSQIQPILEKRCSPCHFPGGKMYEKLPFDTPATILLKKEIILKRIKDDHDNKLIREFIEQEEKD